MKTKIQTPFERPTFLYDGDCSFCIRWVNRFRDKAGKSVDFIPFQSIQHKLPNIPFSELKRSAHFIDTTGLVTDGAEATFRMLSFSPFYAFLKWMYMYIPGFSFISEIVYRSVANNR